MNIGKCYWLAVMALMGFIVGCSTGTAIPGGGDAGLDETKLVSDQCSNGGEVLELSDSWVVVCRGESGSDGSNGGDVSVSVLNASDDDCPNGGKHIVTQESDGSVNQFFVCNGENGSDGSDGNSGDRGDRGKDGTDGEDGSDGVDGSDGSDGTNGSDGSDGQDGADGADGLNGSDAISVTVFREEATTCDNGGESVTVVGANGEETLTVCNGSDGQDGEDGEDGADAEVSVVPASVTDCIAGGHAVTIGDETLLLCNGEDGERGPRGFVGRNGESVMLDTVPEGVDDDCNGLGGVSVTVDDNTEVVCNGRPGDNVSVLVVAAGTDVCPAGGFEFTTETETHVGPRTETVETQLFTDAGADAGVLVEEVPLPMTEVTSSVAVMCNGVDGDSVSVTTRQPGWWECPGFDSFDGTVITLSNISGLDGGTIDTTETVICDGEDGFTPRVSVRPARCNGLGGTTITVNN